MQGYLFLWFCIKNNAVVLHRVISDDSRMGAGHMTSWQSQHEHVKLKPNSKCRIQYRTFCIWTITTTANTAWVLTCFGTKFWSAALWGRAGEPSLSVSAGWGSGWCETPSPAQASGTGCKSAALSGVAHWHPWTSVCPLSTQNTSIRLTQCMTLYCFLHYGTNINFW